MISIVLYGRNDNYGYNLHKRAALSLNCMAEVLTDSADEILFVDYNTPDDFPTFPEAIQDTLTKRARELLRILRVRPSIHERFKSRTHLKALEPIARNVAVRRSSASNRWILSTNTDMIFVPQSGHSLSQIARGLVPGFYHAPRIEIPESLWESLDRRAPAHIIKTVRDWGTALHLNEIVLGSKFIRYDGPGDFQLLLRSDLFENHGFDEDMLLGWHVDSNIAARMLLKYEEVGDLGEHVYGYHCDHTRQVTPAHSHARVQNDWKHFVTDVARPGIPSQSADWGCANDAIEELRLAADPAGVYVQALRNLIGDPLIAPNVVKYTGESYNQVDYDPKHIIPFLADMFVSMPRTFNVGWYGTRGETLGLFAGIWQSLGFTGQILLDREFTHKDGATLAFRDVAAIRNVSQPALLTEADVVLFDFGGLKPAHRSGATDPVGGELRRMFLRIVREERRRLSIGATPRRVIALNAINNEYEGFVCGFLAAAATPFATHMRHGFVLPVSTAWGNWLPLLHVGEAGARVGDQIRSDPTKLGWLAYGPFKYLEEGQYLVSMGIELLVDEPDRPGDEPCLLVEVVAGPELLGVHSLKRAELNASDQKFTFVISHSVADGIAGIETRFAVTRPIGIAVRSMTVELASASDLDDNTISALTISDLLQIGDWLPFLRIGPLGRVDESGVCAECGAAGFVAFGPYWSLPIGRYEMTAHIETSDDPAIPELLIEADVAAGDSQVAAGSFHLGALAHDKKGTTTLLRLPFELNAQNPEQRQIQTRIWSSGEQRFRIRSLSVKPLERRQQEGLLPLRFIGEVGHRVGGQIRNFGKRVGFVAHSQIVALEPGGYRLTLQVAIEPDGDTTLRKSQTCMVVLVKHKDDILAATAIGFEADPTENHELTFEVPADSAATLGIEFALQVVASAKITLRALTLDHAATDVWQTGPAVCNIENWLPFLKTRSSALADDDGVVVSKGPADYAVYGPYWALPAGRYEMIASIVPSAPNPDGKPVVTADITTDNGLRRLAACHWRLGQFQGADVQTAVEFRLPFAVAAGLPAELRTIETRIFTQGDGSFRIRSLTVRVGRDDSVENREAMPAAVLNGVVPIEKASIRIASSLSAKEWLSYFHVEEAGRNTERGIFANGEIGNVGYIQRAFLPGRYETIVRVERAGAGGDPAGQLIILIGGMQVVARIIEFEPRLLGRIRIPRGPFRICSFEVPIGHAELRSVQIHINSIGTGAFLIRSMAVKPKTWLRDLRDQVLAMAAVLFRKLRGALG